MKYAKNINGTVKNYGDLKRLGDYKNYLTFWKQPINIHNAEGFYEVVKPFITKYQKLIVLIPSDLINKKYIHRIYDFKQKEIDDYNQSELDNDDSSLKYSKRQSDGQQQFKQFINYIIRDKNITPNPLITPQQALNVILNFNEGMQFLKDGFQEATKTTINSLNPANQYETDLQILIVDKLTNYINQNPL